MDYMKQYLSIASRARVESITFRKIIYFFYTKNQYNYYENILDEITDFSNNFQKNLWIAESAQNHMWRIWNSILSLRN